MGLQLRTQVFSFCSANKYIYLLLILAMIFFHILMKKCLPDCILYRSLQKICTYIERLTKLEALCRIFWRKFCNIEDFYILYTYLMHPHYNQLQLDNQSFFLKI